MDEDQGERRFADRRVTGKLEQHIQTVLISIATGALLFAANYFYNDNREKAVSKSQIELLTVQVIEMRGDIKTLQINYVRPQEVQDLQRRVLDLERKIQ